MNFLPPKIKKDDDDVAAKKIVRINFFQFPFLLIMTLRTWNLMETSRTDANEQFFLHCRESGLKWADCVWVIVEKWCCFWGEKRCVTIYVDSVWLSKSDSSCVLSRLIRIRSESKTQAASPHTASTAGTAAAVELWKTTFLSYSLIRFCRRRYFRQDCVDSRGHTSIGREREISIWWNWNMRGPFVWRLAKVHRILRDMNTAAVDTISTRVEHKKTYNTEARGRKKSKQKWISTKKSISRICFAMREKS